MVLKRIRATSNFWASLWLKLMFHYDNYVLILMLNCPSFCIDWRLCSTDMHLQWA